MPVRESQKRSNRKWDSENMRSLSCRVRTYEAEDFKAYCDSLNTTPGNLLKKYVMDCIAEYYRTENEAHKDGGE